MSAWEACANRYSSADEMMAGYAGVRRRIERPVVAKSVLKPEPARAVNKAPIPIPARDILDLATKAETVISETAAADHLLPDWLRRPDGGFPRTLADIIAAAVKHHELTRAELLSDRRNRRIVDARHAAIYWSARLSDASLPRIGREFGGRDHTTVINSILRHACRSGLPVVDTGRRQDSRRARERERNALWYERQERAPSMSSANQVRMDQAKARRSPEACEACRAEAVAWCETLNLSFDATRNGREKRNIEARRKLWAALIRDGYATSAIGIVFDCDPETVRKHVRHLRVARIDAGEA